MRSSCYFILTLIVAIPFLIAMIILYVVSLKARERQATAEDYDKPHIGYCPESNLIAADDLKEPRHEYCDAELIATILKRSAGGKNDEMEVACPGVIMGENIVVAIEGCISETDQSDYYVTSGTSHWSTNRNVHRICNVKKINSVHVPNENLMVMEVQPDFPACTRGQNGVTIARVAELKKPFEIKGGQKGTKKEDDSIQNFQVTSDKNGCDLVGALLFDNDKTNYGLLKKCSGDSHEVLFLVYYLDILKYKYKGVSEIILK